MEDSRTRCAAAVHFDGLSRSQGEGEKNGKSCGAHVVGGVQLSVMDRV